MFLQAVEEQPSSFEAVYSHALALQELATRAASEPAEGLRLLTQVILGCRVYREPGSRPRCRATFVATC